MSSPPARDDYDDISDGGIPDSTDTKSDRTRQSAGSDRTVVAFRQHASAGRIDQHRASNAAEASHSIRSPPAVTAEALAALAPSTSAAVPQAAASTSERNLLLLHETVTSTVPDDQRSSLSSAANSNRADLHSFDSAGRLYQIFDAPRDILAAISDDIAGVEAGLDDGREAPAEGLWGDGQASSSTEPGINNTFAVFDLPSFQAMFKAYLEDQADVIAEQHHDLDTVVANTGGVRKGIDKLDEHVASNFEAAAKRLDNEFDQAFQHTIEYLKGQMMELATMLRERLGEEEVSQSQASTSAIASSSRTRASSSQTAASGSSQARPSSSLHEGHQGSDSLPAERVDKATQTDDAEPREDASQEDVLEEDEPQGEGGPRLDKGKGRAP